MSPPENSHKLAEAFAEYLPEGSEYIFLLVEKTGDGAWVSTMSSIQDSEAVIEVLGHAIDKQNGKSPDVLRKMEETNSELYARTCQMVFSGLYDDLTVLELRVKLQEEFVGEGGG